LFVIPAQAGIQVPSLRRQGTIKNWIPAFAGMTSTLDTPFIVVFQRAKVLQDILFLKGRGVEINPEGGRIKIKVGYLLVG
jgi:hypothetical protein